MAVHAQPVLPDPKLCPWPEVVQPTQPLVLEALIAVTNRFECAGDGDNGIHLRWSACATIIQKNQIRCNGHNSILVSVCRITLLTIQVALRTANVICGNSAAGIYLVGAARAAT
jgi:hypothetical protein